MTENEKYTFDEACIEVRKLGLKTESDWRNYTKSKEFDERFYKHPDSAYKNKGWKSWLYFLTGIDKVTIQYYNFNDACIKARTLGLKTIEQWKEYTQSVEFDTQFPKIPYGYYIKNNDWLSWSHFLTGVNKIEYYTFEEACENVKKLELKTTNDWIEYAKSKYFEERFHKYPDSAYKNKGWISYKHFLTGEDNITYYTFDEACTEAIKLGLKTEEQWNNYTKSKDFDIKFPKGPYGVYKDNGWKSFPYFLTGKDKVVFYTFPEADKNVKKLGLKTRNEWYEYVKSKKFDVQFPQNPDIYYKQSGWVYWTNFLTASNKVTFFTFEEACVEARKLDVRTKREWITYTKSIDFDDRFPKNPDSTYKKDNQWQSWSHFLTSIDKVVFYTFKEACIEAKKLELKTREQWKTYTKSSEFDERFPKDGNQYYQDNGWKSWSHFLGYFGDGSHSWSKSLILEFIKEIEHLLPILTSIELLNLINSKNLTGSLTRIGCLDNLLSSNPNSQERLTAIQNTKNIVTNLSDDELDLSDEIEDVLNMDIPKTEIDILNIDTNTDTVETLPIFADLSDFKAYDNELITSSMSIETLDFLLKERSKILWNKILNNEITIEKITNEEGGTNFNIIKNYVLNEHKEMNNIELPSDYIFNHKPNMMQLLTAYRLIKNKYYGNWSGTGAGKTLSAILAGRVANAYNTVIICNNATVKGWVESIDSYFTNNNIYVKKELSDTNTPYNIYDIHNTKLPNNTYNYIILNYETFQQKDGEFIVDKLLENIKIDYLILDEVQNVKQREENILSIRKSNISKLRLGAYEFNNDLLLLAMTATPVVNNYTEAKYLIELVSGVEHNDLDTKENINNGIKIYEALTRLGLRNIPNNKILVNTQKVYRDGKHLTEELLAISSRIPVLFEKILIDDKLLAIQQYIKKGTLIYTHYITDVIDKIKDFVTSLGFSVGLYTGDDKAGLDDFIKKQVDVLIGSSPISTGVDGIQKVCDTLIPIILPWTSSEYDQLIGRVVRQGSMFDKVNIYIPQINIDSWSYDEYRFNIILHKESIADLAVDGKIPSGKIPSKEKLISDAQNKLRELKEAVENDNIEFLERNKITVDLTQCVYNKVRKELPDFSKMNKEWSVSKSSTIYERLKSDNSEWYDYHELYTNKRKEWKEIPYKIIANEIKRADWIVGDFGCGENLLSKEIPNKVYGFDYVAIEENVISCDMSNIPLEDNILDVVVFSLSLMGSNKEDYIKESFRLLKLNGFIYIAEPYKKWDNREDELKQLFISNGFMIYNTKKSSDNKFIYLEGFKK